MTGVSSGPSKVGALILAAGLGRRFGAGNGGSKLAVPLNGQPLVRHVAEAALASRAGEVVVVTGHAAPTVRDALIGLDCRFVHNDAYEQGLAVSLKAGIAALPGEVMGALILLGDMPFIRAELIDGLITAFEVQGDAADAVVPVRAGQWGNPVLLSRRVFADIGSLEGDKGAKGLLRHPDYRVVECPMEEPAIEIDIDTPAMLEALASSPRS